MSSPTRRAKIGAAATIVGLGVVLASFGIAYGSTPQQQTVEPACRPGVVMEVNNAGGYRLCPGYTLAPAGPTTSPKPSATTQPSFTPTSVPTPSPSTVTTTVTTPPAPTTQPPSSAAVPTVTPTVTQTGGRQIKAYLTGYSYFDNTPPGSADISHPIIHNKAGGTGTFADPLTLAVGHTLSGGNDILDWPAGTRFFFPSLGPKGVWAIVEDTCGDGNRPQNGPCHTGYPDDAETWLDIWVDGRTAGEGASNRCMDDITGVVTVIVNPDPNRLPADYVPGPISSADGCQR